MLSGELKVRAERLQREQKKRAEEVQRRQQRERVVQERLQAQRAAHEEGLRQRRLAEEAAAEAVRPCLTLQLLPKPSVCFLRRRIASLMHQPCLLPTTALHLLCS